jgi:hypothetical protein
MFENIAASIAYLRSKAIELLEWLQQGEAPSGSDERAQPPDTPIVDKPTIVPTPSPAPSAPKPSKPRDAHQAKKSTPAARTQQLQDRPQAVPDKRGIVRRVPKVAPDAFSQRGRHLEYLIGQTGNGVRRQFFSGRIVGYTGRLPFESSDIEKLICRLGAIPGFDGLWEPGQLMIIGREGFDPIYLKHSVQVGLQQGFECHYISQEALTELLRFGQLPNYYRGDSRIANHAGLRCVANFGFVWPSTDVTAPTDATSTESESKWRTSHEMVSIYGYRVDARTGLSIAERQERLHRAVAGLGLRCVAEHIAANIQLAKNRRNANMESAIDKWEDDLDWLYDRFYKNSLHAFVWPKVYRQRKKAS